jgi:putative ABC transport system permease protein
MSFLHELRLAGRALRHAPTYTITAVAAIALAIGATTAVFTIVDGVLLRPLPLRGADRLLLLGSDRIDQPAGGVNFIPPSYPDFRDWQEQTRGVLEMAFARGGEALLVRNAEGAEFLGNASVSAGYFGVLGARPSLGRFFTPDEERPGGPRVAVITHEVWRSRFGADPAIAGKTIAATTGALTIVGVLPPGANVFPWAQVYTPNALVLDRLPALAKRDFRVDNRVLARLAPGATIEAARTQLTAIAARLAATYPENAKLTIVALSLQDSITAGVRPALLLLLGAVALLVCIACANVASLTLVRATARDREVAVRIALGANRLRLARGMFAESLVVAGLGSAIGVALAGAGVRAFVAAAPSYLPRLDEVGIDLRVLGVSAALCIGCAVVFAIAPALFTTSANIAHRLRDGGNRAGRGRTGRVVRGGFAVAELALSLVLLVGCGLLVQSFARLSKVDPGFQPDRLVTLRISPEEGAATPAPAMLALFDRIHDAVRAVPGVEAVSFISHIPITGSGVVTTLEIEGRTRAAEQSRDLAWYRLVGDGYFATAGQRIVMGRAFTASEMSPSARSIVVNEAFVKTYLAGQAPIGRRVTVFKQLSSRADYGERIDAQIVGVAADTKDSGLQFQTFPAVFLPMPVNPWRSAFLVVRAAGAPAAIVAPLRAAVRGVSPDLPAKDIVTGPQLIRTSLDQRRLEMILLAAFAVVALSLAVIGVYGVVAFGVAQRTGEIGVRAALGATPAELVRLFVAGGARLAAVGAAAGIALAFPATKLLASQLYGIGARDVATMAGVSLLLALVTLVATWIPARRAARVDPLVVLRAD